MKEDDLAKMEFTVDEEGRELLLKDGKFQVMMEWERPYMEACIKALAPKGDVLEIGFGCGYASDAIQSFGPKSHTIIEYHPVVAEKARGWAKGKRGVKIVEATWQSALKELGKFDVVFFDDYPLETEGEMREKRKQVSQGNEVLEKGQSVLDEAHAAIPQLKMMRYEEREIKEFMALISSGEKPEAGHLIQFLHDLKKDKQIDEAALGLALAEMQSARLITEEDLKTFHATPAKRALFQHQGDRLFTFLDLCIKNHMRDGAVLGCFFEDPTSKYEDKRFVDHIITNPYLDYHEEWISINVPSHCKYYEGDNALVVRIQLHSSTR